MANNQEKRQEENNTITINFLLSSHNSGVMHLFLYYTPIAIMSMEQKGGTINLI
jgi:hypothetical protein